MNDRVTKKERGLIKGALRRVFSRSDLRKEALAAAKIEHVDPKRRTNKWVRCSKCQSPTPQWMADVDHTNPVVPIDKAAYDMSANELVDRIWCDPKKLAILCPECHNIKTQYENCERRKYKKERKNV